MTAAADQDVHFGLVELDLLATHAGVPFPFPLRVPSAGRLAAERDVLLAEVGHALCERGLATAHGPSGLAAELVTALREYRSAIDLVVLGADTATGVLALVYGNRAMLCHQQRAGAVQVRQIAAASLADEVDALVPAVPPAVTMPITLPPGVVGDTLRLLSNTADTPATRRCVRELVREYGGDEAAVDQLVNLLSAVTGQGQLGVTHRSGTRPLELSWLDGPRGRVRVSRDDRGWLSVNPLRRGELVRLMREAATLARV